MEKNETVNVGGNVEAALQGKYSLDVKSILQESWEITQQSRLPIMLGILICAVLSIFVVLFASQFLGGVENAVTDMKAQYIINILITLVISPFIAGIEMMGVFHAVGIKTKSKLVFSFLNKGAIIAVCALLTSTLSSLGLNLLVLPGIFLLVTLSLTVPLVVDKNMMPIQAIILSVKALRFQFFKILAIFGILFMALLFSMLPLLVLFNFGLEVIGVVFLLFSISYLIPLFYNVKGVLYREIFGVKLNVSDAPSSMVNDIDNSDSSGSQNSSSENNGDGGNFSA